MATSNARGKFLWHELMTTDVDAAKQFYGGVVGWKTQAWGQDPSYEMWMTGKRSMGGLMAQRVEGGAGPKPQWFSYIGTPDVDATVRQAVELGGKVMRPAWDIPNVGRIAFLSDPQGAIFAVLAPAPSGGDLGDPTELGNFSWHELYSTNWQTAWEFYSKLFGWQKTEAMDMGAMGIYQMFGQDGTTYGGMFTKAKTQPGPPIWTAYANVRDSKRAAETVKKLGGTILNGPMQVPGGGWIVTGLDPQGAMFSIFSKPVAAKKVVEVKRVKAKPAAKKTKAKSKAKATSRKRGSRKAGARPKKTSKTSRTSKKAGASRKRR